MNKIKTAVLMGSLLPAAPAYAVPSLLPLLPVLGVLIAKGVLLLSSIFFLVLSFYKSNKTLFLILGIVLLFIFILMMIFVRHG